ncbi:MAG: HAD-IA family hydrolase [Pseudomonadota bacterium]
MTTTASLIPLGPDDLKGVAVLFDLDGTLIDTAGDLAAATNQVLKSAGRPTLSTEEMRHLVGFGAKAMIQSGFSATGAPAAEEKLDEYVSQFLDYYMAHIDDYSQPFPNAIEAIQIMRDAGAVIAICTNKREEPARRLIEKLDLNRLFDVIVGGDTASAPKPDKAPVELCLQQLGTSNAIFVGDSDTDVRAANAAGLPVIVVDFGYGPTEETTDATPWLSNYSQLPKLVLQLSRTAMMS